MIGDGVWGELPARLQGRGPDVLLASHPALASRFPVAGLLRRAGCRVHALAIPAGERFKSLRTVERLYREAAALGAERGWPVLALGGGVVGDAAGFFAATYLRGLPLVHLPTTVLAMLDSAIGGKVGVNLPAGKNLVGTFYAPALVLADTSSLASLPRRDLRAGLAEAIKCAAIADEALFGRLEAGLPEPTALPGVIAAAARVKADIVEADERETGPRFLLNFGHTVGHAVERLAGYGRYRHGEAVAIGMAVEAMLAARLGLLAGEACSRLRDLLQAWGLPARLPPLPADGLLAAMGADKKRLGGALRFALPRRLGQGELVPVDEADVRAALLHAGATP